MPGYNSNVGSYRSDSVNVVVLAGGVGGAKLIDGFAQVIPAGKLSAIINTGDDFRHMGLAICPDLDTVLYTLAGEANPETGWGRRDETWRALEEVKRLGGPTWFRLGDLDLALHLVRTAMLEDGHTLTESIQHLGRRLGLVHSILPMSDDPAPTMIECDGGLYSFQDWFVKQSWQPAVKEIHLPADVRATRAVLWALEKADVVILAPSNPFVSVDPILNVYPVRSMIADLPDLVVAVSPIVGGKALKGPAAKMMREMGMVPTPQAVAEHYDDLIDLFVYDRLDAGAFEAARDNDRAYLCTNTVMRDQADRKRLAEEIVNQVMELMES
jgi:LPPG:FO 2-phospho-L-lactate transferase